MSGAKRRSGKAKAGALKADAAGKAAVPGRAKDAVPATGAASTPGAPGDLSQGMKILLVALAIVMLPVGAAYTTLGVQYVIQRGAGAFHERDARISMAFGYALFEGTVILLAAVSVSWLFVYGAADMFAAAHGGRASNVPFAVAMKRLVPTLLGGMWLGHAIRLGLNLQHVDREYLREWALTILATNGPAILASYRRGG